MKLVTITRAFQDDSVTLGMLKISNIDHEPIYTLENPWIGNKPYVSCIPIGRYAVEKFDGVKFKDVFEIMDVTNRSYILLHNGNVEADTSGCVILGLASGSLRNEPAVLQSRDAMDVFRSLVGRKPFTLIIK